MQEVREEFMGKKRTTYMIGMEVEKTPAFGMKTLFVQEFQPFIETHIRAIDNSINHIYLCANRSFHPAHDWNTLVAGLLYAGYIVTFDYPVTYHNIVLNILQTDIWNNSRFIPMITVDISNIADVGNNVIVKIDDPAGINPGVWCLTKSDITDPEKYTDWDEYADDENIK
jgi:hypothetical protein